MRPLKFKLSDTTLTSDVNQTLSNLLSQVNKTNKTVKVVSGLTDSNTKTINGILSNPPQATDALVSYLWSTGDLGAPNATDSATNPQGGSSGAVAVAGNAMQVVAPFTINH